MFGVMRETFERDGGSMRGEEDFFSVARTTPFLAGLEKISFAVVKGWVGWRRCTFYSETGHALVDGVQGVFYLHEFAAVEVS